MEALKIQRQMTAFFTTDHDVHPEKLYKPRDEDIICVGPIKSGTTWMQQILHQLRTKGDETFKDIYEVTCFIPNSTVPIGYDVNAEQVQNPRIFKHHNDYRDTPSTEKQKTIVTLRDPHDTAYSFMKFVNRFYGTDKDLEEWEASEMMEAFHKENKMSNFSVISSWWAHRENPHIMFVFYDDLKKDLKLMVEKIANFVGIPLTDEELAKVVGFCSFEYMAERKEKFKGQNVVDALVEKAGIDKFETKMSMIRVDGGKIGEGSKLGDQLKATVDRLWSETMGKNFGIESYEEMYEKYSLLK